MAPAVPAMTAANLTDALKRLGWRIRNADDLKIAVGDFQRGYALGPAIPISSVNDGPTRVAIRTSLARLKAGQPTASEHFSFTEFTCGCKGRYVDCRRIRVHAALLHGLEVYRHAVGHGITVASGYRCPRHNAEVKGATNSQHVYGAACDVDYALKDAAVASLRVFSGIGRSQSSGLVRHVDVRHVSGNNTTGGTPDRPTRWVYAK